MGKIEIFTIQLDKQQAVYMPGETVSGRLVIKLNKRFKINTVKMSFTGKAHVYWSENYGKNVYQHSADEEYFNFNTVFLAKQSIDDLYMEPGDYSYPFQTTLPTTLPTSFVDEHCYIKYSLNACIVIPWSFDKHVEKVIIIMNPVDLNLNLSLRQLATVQGSKTSEPITAILSIIKRGYVPGEGIPFNAMIVNKSSREIKKLSLKIVQNITLHAKNRTRLFSKVVAEIYYPNRISANSSDEWSNSVLTIPSATPPSNLTCKIIHVHYSIVLNVNPAGMSFSFNVSIPIVIGTIPLVYS